MTSPTELQGFNPSYEERRWSPWEWLAFGICAAAILWSLFYKLGEIPTGAFSDECSVGYNARAIDRTLADQYGTTLPLFFRALEDYKSPLFVYAAAMTEAVFGPTLFAVRLPSTLYILAMALVLFFLIRALTGRQRLAAWLALLSLLFPALFFYARIAVSEVSAFPFYLVLGLLLLLRYERRPSFSSAAWAGAALGLCTYSYTTARLLAPLMIATAALCFAFEPRLRRQLPAFLGAGALAGLPLASFLLLHPGALERRYDRFVSVWRDHPSTAVGLERVVGTYFQHLLSLDFFYRTGQDFQPLNIGKGVFPLWIWLPFLFGLWSAWQRRQNAWIRFLLILLLLCPIPVALTWENLPHTSRILHLAPVVLLFAALAISDWMTAARPPRGLLILGLAGALFDGALGLQDYFLDYAPAFAQRGGMEAKSGATGGTSEILRLAFQTRSKGEPLYLPETFFAASGGIWIDFFGDLDPVRLREGGFEAFGIHHSRGNYQPGALVVTRGSVPPAPGAQLITEASPPKGPPYWSLYRIPYLDPGSPTQGPILP